MRDTVEAGELLHSAQAAAQRVGNCNARELRYSSFNQDDGVGNGQVSLSLSLSLCVSLSLSLRLPLSLSVSLSYARAHTHTHVRLRQDLLPVVQGGVGTEVNEFRRAPSHNGGGGSGVDMGMTMYMAHRAHEVGMQAEDDLAGGFGEGGEEGFTAEGAGSLGFGFEQGLRGLWQAHMGTGETGTRTLSPGNPGFRPRSQSLEDSLFSAAAPLSLLTSGCRSSSKVMSPGFHTVNVLGH